MEFIGELERAFASAIYPNRMLVATVGIVILLAIAFVAWRRRWHLAARRHPRRSLGAALITAAVIGPVGWYLGSPLFLSTTIDEAPPITAGVESPPARSASPASSSDPTAEASGPPPSATTPPGELAGTFAGADEFHFGEGTATLIENGPGQFTVRFENFAVRNGPDLYVYLSPSAGGYADGAIELGRLKADRGNQNYEVPAGTGVSSAKSVVIWCKQFAVLFATAELSSSD